tara:strand:+ start:7844 stop:8911 length:1068 start_codon:yes stop_codon:yes gene_type:complete
MAHGQFSTVTSAETFIGADAKQYFVSPLFLGEEVLGGMDVMTEIKGNQYLDHFSAASFLTTADTGDTFSGKDGTNYTNPLISPIRVEVEIAMNGNNFYNKVKGQVLRSGTDKDNVDGTILKQIGSEILMQGIKADFNRQLWFCDGSKTAVGTGAVVSNASHYKLYNGIFASLASKLIAAQKVTTKYNNTAASTDRATIVLASMYAAATPELRELPKKFYVSGAIADAYVDELVAKGNHVAYADGQAGIPNLRFRGIPLVIRRDWDALLTAEASAIVTTAGSIVNAGITGAGTTNAQYRAALIADNAIVVGTDFSSASVETWYNRDEKELRFRLGYLCDTVCLDAKLGVTYISAVA